MLSLAMAEIVQQLAESTGGSNEVYGIPAACLSGLTPRPLVE